MSEGQVTTIHPQAAPIEAHPDEAEVISVGEEVEPRPEPWGWVSLIAGVVVAVYLLVQYI
jgi:hypothetical protein